MDAHAHRSESGYHETIRPAGELVEGMGAALRSVWRRFRADCGCDGRKARLRAWWYGIADRIIG